MRFNNITIAADTHANASEAANLLGENYKTVSPEEADVVVALGGDGFMLSTMHKFMQKKVRLSTKEKTFLIIFWE